MSYSPDNDPTRAELQSAWQVLVALGVRTIGDTPITELGRIVQGFEEFDPRSHTDLERRFARTLVAIRAELERQRAPRFEGMAAQVMEWSERVGRLERELEAQRRIAEAHFRELCRVEKLLADERQKSALFSSSHVAGATP